MPTNLELYQAGTSVLSDSFVYQLETELDSNIVDVYNQFTYQFALPAVMTSDSYQVSRILTRYYMSRGFHVVNTAVAMKIQWVAPDISWQDYSLTSAISINQIPPNFTAQQLYLIATGGNDLRKIEPYYLYKDLATQINQSRNLHMANSINYYKLVLGIPQDTLTNLYLDTINLLAADNVVAEFLINGILQLSWAGDTVPSIVILDQVIDGGAF